LGHLVGITDRNVKKNTGIMLIDLLLAVAIVGITGVAAIDIMVASGRAGRHTQNMQAAANLCRERLEQIRSISNFSPGTGSNGGDAFLPDLADVSVNEYFPGFYLTESDIYQASDGTPGSLTAMNPPGRVDRITQIRWVDDPTGGSIQDYFRATVTVFWRQDSQTRSVSIETLVGAD
jgi:type II secretory pathway pseudopilin PulG